MEITTKILQLEHDLKSLKREICCLDQNSPGTFWALSGNIGINPLTNFIGTVDNTDFFIKAKGITAGVYENPANPGVDAFNIITTDGNRTYNISNDKPVAGQDHYISIGSSNLVSGEGASILAAYDSGSNENGIIINYDALVPNNSIELRVHSSGVTVTNVIHNILMNLTHTGQFSLYNVASYADDAAAIGAGLVSGNIYKTTTGGSTFLKIVP